MLFRFLKYEFVDGHDRHVGASFITGIIINENYNLFFDTMKNAKGMNIEVEDYWYTIDDIVFHYDGGEDDVFTCNIYCIEY